MTATALFVALFGILACLADAQLRRGTDLLPKDGRELTTLKLKGRNPSFDLGKCEGDCDEDSDCVGQLICFQRSSGGSGRVPGCSGEDTTSTDYCIDPADIGAPTGSPPTAPTAPAPTSSRPALYSYGRSPPSSVLPLGLCEGDCDSDSDCASGLRCLQRGSNAGPVPGCAGSDSTSTDYCVASNSSPSAPGPSPTAPAPTSSSALYSYGRSPPRSVLPLGLCEGDCDSDSDCASGLRCLQRGSNAGPVPGCTGSDSTSTDYCVASNSSPSAPGPSPTAPAPTSSSVSQNFKLKMYWEDGYFWQEETFERKWCMRCRNGSCSLGDRLHIENCSTDGVQRFDFVYIDSSQAQIKLRGTNLCLERSDYDIFINNCDSGDANQYFFAKSGGFDQYRFEISPVTATDLCVTNDTHHPKADEVVHLEPCSWPRGSDTSYWERCYDDSC